MIRLEHDSPGEMAGAEPLVLDLWNEAAREGTIWVPHTVTNAWAAALRMALYRLRSKAEVELLIDCVGGHAFSFGPCHELWWRWRNRKLIVSDGKSSDSQPNLKTTSTVIGSARSIGLSCSVCAAHRKAAPDAVFAVHGGMQRFGKRVAASARGIEGLIDQEDHYIADWLARFTKRTYAEWLDLVSSEEVREFGVAEALEWGVIDKVLEGI